MASNRERTGSVSSTGSGSKKRADSPGSRKQPMEEPSPKAADESKKSKESEKKDSESLKLKHFFYVPNIIDYGRLVFLWFAVNSEGWMFALYYILSYALDAIDGIAARKLGQESKLGYWLDMIIDRISSSVCLHLAAKAVQSGKTFVPPEFSNFLAVALIVSIFVVEILAHGIVMFVAEVMGIHQKKLGGDWRLVRWYLGLELKDGKIQQKGGTNWMLLWACASFEFFGVGLIVNNMPMVILSSPGFIFRAMANSARVFACVPILFMSKEERAKLKKE